MSGSVVFYRFKAQKEASNIQFEGTGISVWDLKKEILAENKLGKGADFDFAIYNADTNEEYSDDKAIVPRSTSVIARRLPPSKPGRGNAQYYMVSNSALPSVPIIASASTSAAVPAGRRGHLSKRFDGREDSPPKPQNQNSQALTSGSLTNLDEASKLAAFFGNTNEQWRDTQEKMSIATPIYFGAGRGRGAGGPRPPNASVAPDKPVPPGYVCYRCGQPGHWIQDCPTNDKPEWDNKPRIKRTTGIPKSFLQTVEAPLQDGEVSHQPGVMIGSNGGFVIARPDAASWEKHRAVQANLSQNDIENLTPTDPDLTCSLCNRLLRDAVKTPCCSTSYCEECIQNYLSENDFVCPECESKIKSLKNLVKDDERRTRAKEYLDYTLKASKAQTEKERAEAHGDGEHFGSEDGTHKIEDLGEGEEGELAGDDQQFSNSRAGRSTSPRSNRALSPVPQGIMSNYINSKYGQNGQNGQTLGMMVSNGGGMNVNTMNGSGYQNMFNGMGGVPPQLQMLQNQIQQTMNILQSPSLPGQMRIQLAAQLQGLQFQYGQMMQMMQLNGSFGGPGMLMQQQMAVQMHQMQQMQQMQQMVMMQQQQQQQQQDRSTVGMYGGMNTQQQRYGNQARYSNRNMSRPSNYHQANANADSNISLKANLTNDTPITPTPMISSTSAPSAATPSTSSTSAGAEVSRNGAQFQEDSAESPYMRVPANPKFRIGGVKRERPEDFVELGSQPIKRIQSNSQGQ